MSWLLRGLCSAEVQRHFFSREPASLRAVRIGVRVLPSRTAKESAEQHPALQPFPGIADARAGDSHTASTGSYRPCALAPRPGGDGEPIRLLPTVPTHTQSAHASARAELDGGQACALPGPPAAPPRPERPTARWGRHAWPQARFWSRLAMKRGCAPLLPWLRQRDASAKGWHPTRRPDGAGPRLARRGHRPPRPQTWLPLTASAPFASLTR